MPPATGRSYYYKIRGDAGARIDWTNGRCKYGICTTPGDTQMNVTGFFFGNDDAADERKARYDRTQQLRQYHKLKGYGGSVMSDPENWNSRGHGPRLPIEFGKDRRFWRFPTPWRDASAGWPNTPNIPETPPTCTVS
jgi:hypothetical protein